MLTFDATSREVCVARRETTATPLQALVLLDDPQFLEASRVLAGRLIKECGSDLEARWRLAFRLVLGRGPRERELEVLRRLHDEQLAFYRKSPGDARSFVSIGETPLDESIPVEELAATTVIASAMMNHDEFVMKR